MTVYVIDDDEAVRNSICLVLELHGFSARPFASGEEFLQVPRPDGDSCLVIDMTMPGLTGLQVIERLRREGSSVPAILMTGDVRERMLAVAARAEVALLEKPFRPGELIDRVHHALHR
ncbi:MAG TPA: response regulator [Stellaceae bacterium]|nr:response regulator [Stellaceae bacterium]